MKSKRRKNKKCKQNLLILCRRHHRNEAVRDWRQRMPTTREYTEIIQNVLRHIRKCHSFLNEMSPAEYFNYFSTPQNNEKLIECIRLYMYWFFLHNPEAQAVQTNPWFLIAQFRAHFERLVLSFGPA